MKLAEQSPQRMRELSSLWVPPIYPRLLSADKPERDMAERCLIKVSSVLLPPQPLLAKIVASDLERQLLSCMMNMLDDPFKKVQAVNSWGWIISFLGSSAVSNRPLLNKLLKVPEQMFIDHDLQVQLATMVSKTISRIFRLLLQGITTEPKAQLAFAQIPLICTAYNKNGFNNIQAFHDICRFMKLSSFGLKANPTGRHQVTNRVFKFLSASVGNFILKKDILLLVEIIGDQLFEWLSLAGTYYCEMQQGGTIYQLERLWIKIVERLKMSQLINDDSFFSHQKLLQAALNHPHHPILTATASVWRPATSSSQQHPACLASKLDELLNHRPKDLDNLGHANKIVHERIDVSRRFALPLPEKRTTPSNETEDEVNGGILKISVGLGRKRLKITKYPTKPKEFGKNVAQFGSPSPRKDTTNVFSPCCMESKVCRKPELILEMLKRQR
ncbi:hypothetical protein PR202_ga01534 [Eleusine coracana subsp. coracana]|uniref:Telomere-associated protein Rif1 N-terminal domain-containing protein n=1 Tax=Eleusine coracana subsp. coracana TaxID=191504 RepID=A0AAV5BFC7_ELECO|nr:hypothetical protein PR202_ga00847 [Eleusine coracana subsp. coracana]GJM85738.1 hypothetical protein PR202_ga01534 [Eleusine coracana subsp. coracana]